MTDFQRIFTPDVQSATKHMKFDNFALTNHRKIIADSTTLQSLLLYVCVNNEEKSEGFFGELGKLSDFILV